MNTIMLIGLDLAKSVFQVHGVDSEGQAVLKKRLTRAKVAEFFAQVAPCVVAMEACGSAHHWARLLASFGHAPKLIPPQYVKPFVRTHKHDAADAEAIAIAARQPGIPTVTIKTPEQQAMLAVHRAREGFIKARTATCHQIRGLLTEFGRVLPVGAPQIEAHVPEILEAGEQELPVLLRQVIRQLYEHLQYLAQQGKL